ncbi:hypothetical protein QE410_003003 [Microbacterium sp. SORGH_AS 1204]|uniref:hypothetical protein n=1 Tax=Microbacterium sp. SORGH_AS_1204 TaxID=3041785 RepID=UPI0027932E77|nr:hypothetical protein [Microbacterium sp. SORGH_AS_1204]MDQ1138204.1 hypothetical protein [Microbacterium sp. SORGH_AS_1204]
MTSNVFTWAQPTPLRRTTFVATPADATARRLYVGVTAAAAAVSVLAVSAIASLVF